MQAFGSIPRGVGLGFMLLIIIAALAGGVRAQDYNFQHYGAGDGLPQVQVFAITQDADGYLWVGTYSGLGRYNGRRFDNFTRADGLGANVIPAVAVDGSGRLWAGTGSGLCRYEPGTNRFHCPEGEGLEGAYVHTLLTEGDDVVWAGTDRGLYRLEGDRIERVGLEAGSKPGDVRSLAIDDDGNLWVGTAEGLLRRAATAGPFEPVPLPNESRTAVTALYADGRRMWIGTGAGLFTYGGRTIRRVQEIPSSWTDAVISGIVRDDNGELWVVSERGVLWQRDDDFRLLERRNGLVNEITHTVFVDGDGLVWFGHDDGLSKWIASPFLGYRTRHGLIDNFVRTIAQDDLKRMWFGTRNGMQIVEMDDGDWDFDSARRLTLESGLPGERIYSVDFPVAGEALIATDNGLVRWREDEGVVDVLTEADGLPVDQTQSVLVDHSGGVWVGTNLGTVYLEDGEIRPVDDPVLAGAYVFRIRQDTAGRVWFGTRDNGLFILAGGEYKRFGADEGVTNESIWDLAPAGDSSMWVGSNGDGLFQVYADGRVEHYTTADGLVDDFVWQVLEDSHGHVWAYTNQGLSRFDGERFRNFSRADGLLHPEGGATGALESHDGQLWFASADGLMRYDPEHSIERTPQPPPIVIERVMHEGQRLPPGAELAAGAGNLDMHFAALSFYSADALSYRYRLIGTGDSWSEPVAYRPVTFGKLTGGEYAFEVQARYPESDWSTPPARFEFSVRPYFWNTAWFWTLAAVLGVLTVWMLVRLRLRASELRRQALEQQVAERTRALKDANRKLESAAITDQLTGLHNRRFLVNQIDADVAQSRRAHAGPADHPNRDIVFMMVDLDHFKEINDTYGHLVGDQVLRGYSEILRRQLRTSDYVVRWGGEEFLVVARQTEATRLNVIAERMLAEAREAVFPVDGVEGGLRCTCSIGVSHFPFVRSKPDALNWEQIVDVADCAIYMAKDLGRNGWVAIHGTEKSQVDDAQAFLRRVKTDLPGLVENGEVVVEGSFPDPMKGAPKGP